MEELKRFTDFDSLKLAAKSTQKTASAQSEKLKEQSAFFELLRAHFEQLKIRNSKGDR